MKLLSPKSFAEFSAEEYHEYIKSLNKPREIVFARKEQKDLKVRVKRKKNGELSVVTKRSPLYVTEKEIETISKETAIPQSELFLVFRAREFSVYATHREAAAITKTIADIPW